jgi:RimJ/RimL family protein N-acetyltransferase
LPVELAEITAGPLHLRVPQLGEVEQIAEACSDPEIARWTRVPTPYRRDDAVAFVHRSLEDWDADRAATFAVLDATTAGVLGSVRLAFAPAYDPDQPGGPTASVGYWVAPEARGAGVGRRAVASLCRWGFGFLALERISWTAAVGNDASRHLAEAVGFTVEGLARRGLVLDGRRVDAWTGSLLPGEVR